VLKRLQGIEVDVLGRAAPTTTEEGKTSDSEMTGEHFSTPAWEVDEIPGTTRVPVVEMIPECKKVRVPKYRVVKKMVGEEE